MSSPRKKVAIIGGGTAGITIASALSNDFSVSVFEKSEYKSYPFRFKPPLLIGLLLRKKNKFISRKNLKGNNKRVIPFFESNVLGGASEINGCVHMFGNKNKWIEILKKFDLNYSQLSESYSFLFSERITKKNKISILSSAQNEIDKAFFCALAEMGLSAKSMNFSDDTGFGPVLNNTSKYTRSSVLNFIKRNHRNKIDFHLDELVEDLLFDKNGNVNGLKTKTGSYYADYIVISAGVIGTNRFLKKLSSKHSFLKNYSNLIGNNIQDHSNLRINLVANKSINSLNELSGSFIKSLLLGLKHLLGFKTIMRGTGATSAAHLDLDEDGVVDTRIQIVQFSENGRHGSNGKLFNNTKPGFSISITAINPLSRGCINNNEIIEPKYFSRSEDIDHLEKALKFCLKLINNKHIKEYIDEIQDEELIISDPRKYILENFYSGYHLIGGAQDLVNSNFELKGTKNIFICDASIFSSFAASNIHSSVILISHLFAKKFKNLFAHFSLR